MTPVSLGLGLGLTAPAVEQPLRVLARFASASAFPAGTVYSRPDATVCATYVDAAGVEQTVAADVLRDQHYVGGVRTILLESSRKNVVVQNTSILAASGWGVDGGCTSTVGQADPAGGTNATRLAGVGAAGSAFRRSVVFTGNGTKSGLVHVKQGTGLVPEFGIIDDTAGTWRHRVRATFAAGVPTLSTRAGAGVLLPPIDLGDDWWGCAFSAPGVLAPNDNRLTLFPTVAATLDTAYFAFPQAEDAAFPTSSIKTAAAAITRAVDSLVIAAPVVSFPTDLTLYQRWVDLSTLLVADAAAAYVPNTAITPAVDRAYLEIGTILQGSLTAAQCRAILGY